MLQSRSCIGNYHLLDFCEVNYKGHWLLAPKTFMLSSDENRKQICNGGGPRGWGWAVPDNILGDNCTAAFDIHDWMYAEKVDKHISDLFMLLNCCRIVNNGHALDIPQLRLIMDYYIAVSKGGQKAFDNVQKIVLDKPASRTVQ